jgi:hypothetical protein
MTGVFRFDYSTRSALVLPTGSQTPTPSALPAKPSRR